MMYVGVRELKNEASEVIRAVRERQAKYVVTFRGRPVAVILPVPSAASFDLERAVASEDQGDADYWAELDALRAEINAKWQSDKSGVELVAEQRR
jgi:prevent-host-death family protein